MSPTVARSSFRLTRGRALGRLLAAAVLLAAAAPRPLAAQAVTVVDRGLETGFQDSSFGHFNRNRATVVADFDLDGRPDVFLGNPGDESFVLRSVPAGNGGTRFELAQLLLTGEVAWAGAAADYDEDGDPDLFVAIGGNEANGLDHLFKNLWVETGQLLFEDATAQAGVAGPVPAGGDAPVGVASAGAVWGDVDNDGNVDLFVSVDIAEEDSPTLADGTQADCSGGGLDTRDHIPPAELNGRNILWHNNGNGTFTDVTVAAGLAGTLRGTRHATLFDFDNDGDLDLYEPNFLADNVLWRNRGDGTFEDVTAAFSPAGEDLRRPWAAFASAPLDVNNDGWQDLLVFTRFRTEPSFPYGQGHVLFINQRGTGFMNLADPLGLNNPYAGDPGVMGCQVGDLNADGYPDVYLGNGGPESGQADQLYLTGTLPSGQTRYFNRTALIDFPAPEGPGAPPYPPYPYRTHGTGMADFDGDGLLELAVGNGGPAALPGTGEPNRMFDFVWATPPAWLKVRLRGDGTRVNRDAIGARVAARVRRGGGAPWTVWGTLYGGSGFSAQNGFDIFLGLRDADRVESLLVFWPDGQLETVTGVSVNTTVEVGR